MKDLRKIDAAFTIPSKEDRRNAHAVLQALNHMENDDDRELLLAVALRAARYATHKGESLEIGTGDLLVTAAVLVHEDLVNGA